jgi:drug/metabolite transporter (DMT)-like permease
LWYLAFVLLSPVDLIVSKMLYNRIPTLGPFQITFFRSVIVVALIAIYLNLRLKKEIYTKLKGLPIKPLIFRNLQSGSAAIVNTAVAGVLSLTMIAVIKSLIPTFVVIIAWLTLGEQLKIF